MEDKDYDSKEKESITRQGFNTKRNVKNLKNHGTPKRENGLEQIERYLFLVRKIQHLQGISCSSVNV